jgi:hypothetical protein
MFKTLAYVRGAVRVINIQFEANIPVAIIDGSRVPLDPALLRHVLQDDVAYWYALEVLHP